MTEEIHLDPEKQARAKEYARTRHRLMLVNLVIGAVYLIIWLATGWSIDLRNFLLEFTTNPYLLVLLFTVVFGGILYLISLPLSFYEGYTLPHRYGLSNQDLSGWLLDQVKGILVSGFLGLFILEIIYLVLRVAPDIWWLWAAGILLLFNVLLANLAPVLIFPIFYKFSPLGDEYSELTESLMQLAKKTGTYVKGVFQFDMSRRTNAANAALTGLGRTRRIILGDTLIQEFSTEEVETVLAHELGHHAHHDITYGILIESTITLVGFYLVSVGLNWGVAYFGFESIADIAGLPLLVLVLGIFGLITMPLTNAYSRYRETRADQFALKVTGNGGAYASALTRLANQNLADTEPEAWIEFLLHSHPSLGKRIQMAEEFSAN